MKSHIGFKCDYCTEVFPKHSILLSHVFETHKQMDKIYKCHYESCNKSYLCKMYLTSHITKSHTKPTTTTTTLTTTATKERENQSVAEKGLTKLYRCEYESCSKEFSTASKLNRHGLTHIKAKNFKCSFEDCNAEFSRHDHLVNHVKFHNDHKLYECDFPGNYYYIFENAGYVKQTCAPKGFNLGLDFQFLSFGFRFEYFANL